MSTILLRFLGITIINIYIYFRFFKQRLPTTLFMYSIENNCFYYNYYLLTLSLFFCVFSCFLALQIIRTLLKKEYHDKKTIITLYLKIIIDFVKKTMLSLYELSAQKFSYQQIRKFCQYIFNIFNEKEKYMIFLFLGIPYIFVPLVLVSDTFVFFTLKNFYKTLFLFSLPLIYNMYRYVLQDIVSNLEVLDEEITCTYVENEGIILEIKDGFDEETKKNIEEIDIPEYIELYSLKVFMENLKTLEDYYKPWFLLFMYLTYLLCWSYIIFYNIFTLLLFF